MVDAVNDGAVGTLRGGRDKDPLGTVLEVDGGFVPVGEDAGTLHHDINILPWKLGRGAQSGDANRAEANVNAVIGGRDGGGKAAMHAVEFQKVGIRLNRGEIVDGHDMQVGAAGFNNRAQHVAPDASKAVDGDLDSHLGCPFGNLSSLALTLAVWICQSRGV